MRCNLVPYRRASASYQSTRQLDVPRKGNVAGLPGATQIRAIWARPGAGARTGCEPGWRNSTSPIVDGRAGGYAQRDSHADYPSQCFR